MAQQLNIVDNMDKWLVMNILSYVAHLELLQFCSFYVLEIIYLRNENLNVELIMV